MRSIDRECRTYRISRRATAASLAYRVYPAANGDKKNIAILIHGSGGHSTGMNGIAKKLAAENFLVVVPDIRGHGASGTRGDIGYYGQLDDDLDDLVAELRRQYLTGHFALLGFSSGGGFALRAAARKSVRRIHAARASVSLSRL